MRLAVLGKPVSRSLSPAIQTAALAYSGIPGSYTAQEVVEEEFAEAVCEVRSGELDGANVTMPYKSLAVRLSDRCTAEAARARAVNTLVRVGDAVVGHNTDIPGIQDAWTWSKLDRVGPVVILGAGGAAAAALLALEGRPLTVAARRPEAARELVEALGVKAQCTGLNVAVGGTTVVNATPVGMLGETLPSNLIDGCIGYFEMAYTAGRTPAELKIEACGLPTSAGTDLLVAQARISFRLWTGQDVPASYLQDVVQARL